MSYPGRKIIAMDFLCRRGHTVSYPRRKMIAMDSLSRRGCNVSDT